MKTLYLECNMGAAGDMLFAALLELHPDPEDFLRRFNALAIPGVLVAAHAVVKCGISGTSVEVRVLGEEEHSEDVLPEAHHHGQLEHVHHGHEHIEPHHHAHTEPHSHTGMREIEEIVGKLQIPEKVREDALRVYQLIAKAESHAHGKPVNLIHFHEVGALDAIADVVGVCLLIHELAPERVLASAIHVGSGQVRCAHGILPVPAPATAYILQGVPIYGGDVQGELCTPTGAALLKDFVDDFGSCPVMKVGKIGYGMGKKDFTAANCVRAMLGETEERAGQVVELVCNLDDMTPEAVGFAVERLLAGGALDVYVTPVQMKKDRPGILLTCMCRENLREAILRLMFQHTTTLGVRESICRRYTMQRSESAKGTPYGDVRVKRASGWGVEREKPEYEDLARIAREQKMSLADVIALLKIK